MRKPWSQRAIAAEALAFEMLSEGYSVQIPMTGSSMSPFVRDSDLVTLTPLDRDPVRGEIVAFRRPDSRMIVHRVVAIDSGKLLLRGDAARVADGWIDAHGVIGRVSAVERSGTERNLGLGFESGMISIVSRLGILVWMLAPLRFWLRRRNRALGEGSDRAE